MTDFKWPVFGSWKPTLLSWATSLGKLVLLLGGKIDLSAIDLTTYTPTITTNDPTNFTLSSTAINSAWYLKLGKLCLVIGDITTTVAGTNRYILKVSCPVLPYAGGNGIWTGWGGIDTATSAYVGARVDMTVSTAMINIFYSAGLTLIPVGATTFRFGIIYRISE